MEIITHSTQETKELAVKLAQSLKKGDVVALFGELGSGKTTFTRFITWALGLKSRVQSPTFVILRKYESTELTINHLDLYRLTSKDEVLEIGFNELLADKNALTIIEWPEVIADLLPKSAISIYFEYIDENSRKITVQNLS